jgi:tetratricopeptide (TPR) repeat protein
LHVIARTSTLQYRDTTKTVETIGEELGVNYLVEGSVRRAGNRVKVTVQLIDCNNGNHLWADDFDRSLNDIFAIQADVAKEIAGQLQAVLSPKEITEIEYRPTENQEAYDYYVRARNLEGSGNQPLNEIISLLEQAVAQDPNFAEAWAQLAGQLIHRWANFGNRADMDQHNRAYAAIEQAKRLGPDLEDIPYNLSKFAFNEHHDPEGSISLMLQAMAINPKAKLGHLLLVNRYIRLGRLAEAQHHGEAAVRIDPLLWLANDRLTDTYVRRRIWDKAIALIQKNATRSEDNRWTRKLTSTQYLHTGDKNAFGKAIELLPGYSEDSYLQLKRSLIARDYSNALLHLADLDPEGRSWLEYHSRSGFTIRLPLVASLIWFVQDDKSKWLAEVAIARANYEERTENPMGVPTIWSQLSICYALEGKTDQMESVIAEAREKALHPYYKYTNQAEVEMNIAICYLVLGDHDKAIETLEAASGLDSPLFLNRELNLWFIFDRLRGNPRFDALLED